MRGQSRRMPWQETGFDIAYFDEEDEHHTTPHRVRVSHVPEGEHQQEDLVPETERRRGPPRKRSGTPRRVTIEAETRAQQAALRHSRAPRPKATMRGAEKEALPEDFAAKDEPIKREINRGIKKGRRKNVKTATRKEAFVDFDKIAKEAGFKEAPVMDDEEEDDDDA